MNESKAIWPWAYFLVIAAAWPIAVIAGSYVGDVSGNFFKQSTWVGFFLTPESPGFFLLLFSLLGHVFGLWEFWRGSSRVGASISIACSAFAALFAWGAAVVSLYGG